MAKKAGKTLAMRILDSKKIAYEIFTFAPDIHSAAGVAEALNLPPTKVYKTLVVTRSPGKPLLVMAPADQELDLKHLARAVNEKKLGMAAHHEAEKLTGLRVGGISALALLNKGFQICILRQARDLEQIVISAGKRGINLRLPVKALIEITGARFV